MVSGVAVKTMSPVVDTSAISKIQSGSRRRLSFFKRSSSNETSSTVSSGRSAYPSSYKRSVRFARKQDIKVLPPKNAEDSANMHYSKPELQAIAAEMIKTVIMCQQGISINGEQGCMRGLESTQSQLGDKALTIARTKYIRSVVDEYRSMKRSRKSKDIIRDRLCTVSCEQTAENRREGVRLGKADAAAVGSTVYTPSVKSTRYAVSPRPTPVSYSPKETVGIEAVLSQDDGLEC